MGMRGLGGVGGAGSVGGYMFSTVELSKQRVELSSLGVTRGGPSTSQRLGTVSNEQSEV